MEEIWKDIKGYEGLYEVSNYGNVKSLERYVNHEEEGFKKIIRERILKKEIQNGYERVSLCNNGVSKRFFVHRLVAYSFIENKNNKPFVNHINSTRNDNFVSNLEWCTASENSIHGYKHGKMKSPKVMLGKFGFDCWNSKKCSQYSIDGNFIKTYGSMLEAERQTGIYHTYISMCLRGKMKKAGGFLWK